MKVVQEIYNKLSVNYWFTSLAISVMTFVLFLFFTTKVKWLPFDSSSLVVSVAMSILIGYQYAFVKNISSKIRLTFEKLRPLFQNNHYQTFSQHLERKLQKSWLFYSTIIIVIAPFVILELIKVWKWKLSNGVPPYFYLFDPTPWSLLLDAFNEVIGYSILFLLAIIIWIIIELTLNISELQKNDEVKIDVFDVEEIGGLKPLSSFVLFIVSNYFIIITLTIISYVPPNATTYFRIYSKVLITPEIIILVVMLLIGVILFITTQKTIRNLIDKGIRLELEKINRNYKEAYDRVIEICSNNRTVGNKNELEELRVTLDILEKERTKIKQIQDKKFDTKMMITFMSTVLLPTLTLIKQIMNLSN
jgi:hypothetical protein